jgi:hypothetical protein
MPRENVVILVKARGVGDARSQLSDDCMKRNQPNIIHLLIFLEAIIQRAEISIDQYFGGSTVGGALVGAPKVGGRKVSGPTVGVREEGVSDRIQRLENERYGSLRELHGFMIDHRKTIEGIRILSNRIAGNSFDETWQSPVTSCAMKINRIGAVTMTLLGFMTKS